MGHEEARSKWFDSQLLKEGLLGSCQVRTSFTKLESYPAHDKFQSRSGVILNQQRGDSCFEQTRKAQLEDRCWFGTMAKRNRPNKTSPLEHSFAAHPYLQQQTPSCRFRAIHRTNNQDRPKATNKNNSGALHISNPPAATRATNYTAAPLPLQKKTQARHSRCRSSSSSRHSHRRRALRGPP